MTVSDLLTNNFVNNLKYIVVCDSNGNVIFDGANGIDLSTASTDYIGTGSYISLYDSDDSVSRLLIDCVEIVVVGDLDGNGIITAYDVTKINEFNRDKNTLLNSQLTSASYLAGLTGNLAYLKSGNATTLNVYLRKNNSDTDKKFYLYDYLKSIS